MKAKITMAIATRTMRGFLKDSPDSFLDIRQIVRISFKSDIFTTHSISFRIKAT
ncbi:MAG: hypothetical protein A4E28_00211 [Methanocella sp. PtaU1.Bin125]|nr:MAG: hypothetical protein A4E28_00211 [Methanocella sp. PtaU1.Bin125]